jgi:hypothetical protein
VTVDADGTPAGTLLAPPRFQARTDGRSECLIRVSLGVLGVPYARARAREVSGLSRGAALDLAGVWDGGH